MKLSFSTKLVTMLLVATLSACSNSKKDDDPDAPPSEDNPAEEASTDSVPAENAEAVQASSDTPPSEGAPPSDTASTEPAPDAAPPAPADVAAAPVDAVAPPPSAEPIAAAEPVPAQVEPVASQGSQGTGEYDEYTVRRGDTLMKIAFEVYGDLYQWKRIHDLNRDKFPNANRIPRGAKLKIEKPAGQFAADSKGEKYRIKEGDTLASISQEVYGTKRKWKRIFENNKDLIKNANQIYAGFMIFYTFSEKDRSDKERFQQEQGSLSQGQEQPGQAEEAAPRNPAQAQTDAVQQNQQPQELPQELPQQLPVQPNGN